MARKLRITIVVPSLSGGGAERSVVLFCQGFLRKGHAINVITLSARGTDVFILPNEISRLALGIAADSSTVFHAVRSNLSRLRTLRRAIKSTSPDLVISHTAQTNVLTRIALLGTQYPVVVVEHSDPERNSRRLIWRISRRLIYSHVAQVVSVSSGINSHFEWVRDSKKMIIRNPVSLAEIDERHTRPQIEFASDLNFVVAMGRLVHVKGFDRLILAFERIAPKFPEWRLVILGEGELRSHLEQLIERLGLSNRVHLPGFIEGPFALFKKAKFFVLSSYSEGFPYALLEAMACGLPAIAMDCPSGPREIIRHEVDGLLVPNGDVEQLAAMMDRLMSDEDERERLALRAPEVFERFGLESAISQWEALFAEIV